jgi:hypothetical protein
VTFTITVLLLATAAAANGAADQIKPNAGSWKTWVISSGRDFRTPPPNEAAAGAEISELKTLQKT